ncbi:retrovirus-related pol polyprotein from transposon TNT 1-94 [Tanacetum coccineum]
MQQPMLNLEDISYPTTAMNMALVLMAKAFKLNYFTPTKNNKRISSNPYNKQIAQLGMNMGQDRQIQMVGGNGNGNGNNRNQIRCYNYRGMGHLARNCTVRPKRRDAASLQTQLLNAQKEEAGIQLQAEEFDLMTAARDLDKIEEVNANCILMANLQQALTSSTQTNKAPVYDSNGSAKPHMIQQNNSNVISVESSVEHNGGTIEQHPTTVEETQATKFVQDFKSLAKEADESLAKHKALELENERLLRAVVSQDIMSIVQNPTVVETSDLQTELERTKESMDTQCASDTLDPLSRKLEDENVSLEF